MKNAMRLTLFGLLGVMLTFTGCASKKKNRLNALEARVNQMTDEVTRLDQQLQETRASIQTQENARSEAAATSSSRHGSSSSTYRTPSGFELPSFDIQQALKNAGYYSGNVDGKIGPTTRTAVKSFQRDHGLEPDGVIGRRTWGKLKTYLSATAAPKA